MEDEDSDVSSPSSNMPLIRKIETSALDIRLFEPSILASDGLFVILAKVNQALYLSPGAVVETLLSKANLFEYIFSALEDADAQIITNFFITGFPFTSENFRDSLSSKVLRRIAEFIFLLPYDSEDVEKPEHSSRHFAKVEAGIQALNMLDVLTFSAAEDVSEDEDNFFSANIKRKLRGRQKRHRQSRQSISFDTNLLKAFDESVPTCQEEVNFLTAKLLSELELILQMYLADLRSPSLAGLIRGQYIKTGKTVSIQVTRQEKSVTPLEPSNVASAVAELPKADSAYPNVQPLRASLYFDSVQGFGEWRVFISTRAEKHLREHRKNQPTFKIIVKKIKELSRGHFSDDNQKRLSGPDKGIPMYEAKLSGDLRLIYQVDCISDYESDVERQVIRVYGIFTHAQMNKHLWDYLSTHLQNKGAEYRRRVTYRRKPEVTGDNVFLPESWPPEQREADAEHSTIAISADAAGLQDIHQWMVLEKYVAFTQTLLTCILADQEVSHVFNVSPYEREIIEHDSSCYVLGRSGTGKTTTMLFKIFGIERAVKSQIRQNLLSKPLRQLFVTQSRVLAGRVEDYYKKLSDFLQTAYMSKDELRERHRSKKNEEEEELVDLDEEEWHEDLPKRFSELEDRHFPLFLTFDKLCKMLEADLGLSFARQQYTKEHKRAQKRFKISNVSVSEDLADDDEALEDAEPAPDTPLSPIEIATNEEELSSSLVTYDAFRRDYWPHLPQNLTKTLDPALVFSEFMGVIKGSEDSLCAEKGYLSRDKYLKLSHRTQSTFYLSREEVYDLFEAYQKRKNSQRDYDAADRTHAIIQEMRRRGKVSQKVDFLYVDEAQDNLLIDAHLLRLLCSNPHGLFWAGDTAQTIAIGSSFRFNDLKSFLHRVEETVDNQPVKPSSFQLTMNYRSHGGIVSCADSVIQLITKFWPYSIDILRREKGAVEGSKPVFFVGWEKDTLRYEQFLFGDNGNAIEFGAQQCILVRNDTARDLLRKQVGEIGVIMTLYESKGLEFDDVLLHNFFEDSPCDLSQWRMVLNALDTETLHGLAVPQFNDLRHAGICSELKFLYVAMTRARKNLWIADKSDKGSAMRIFFESKNLVDLRTPEQTPALGVKSSPDEWAKMGRSLFFNKQYHQAMYCFEQAGLDMEKAISHAYYLRQQAQAFSKTTRTLAQRKQAFASAAQAFVGCARDSSRANDSYWRNAGKCFVEADEPRQAAQSFFNARLYTEAAKQYKQANMYDEAVDIVQTKRKFVEDHVAENILKVSRLHFLRIQRPEKTITLFDTFEEGMEFVEDYGTDKSRADLLEKLGRYSEAAELNMLDGQLKDAVRLFQLANNVDASSQAAVCVLSRLWEMFSFGAPIGRIDEAIELLDLGSKLESSHLSPNILAQLEMFTALNEAKHLKPSQSLNTLHQHFRFDLGDNASTIFCFDQLVKRFEPSDLHNPDRARSTLSSFLSFADLVRREIWNSKDSIEDDRLRKLLGIKQDMERNHEFTVLDNSLLFKHRIFSRRFDRLAEFERTMDRDTLFNLIRDTIPNYLCETARTFNKLCLGSRAFRTPCLNFAAHGSCNSRECDREHVVPSEVHTDWFKTRFHIHLQMVACLQMVDFALDDRDRIYYHRLWLERISELLFPAIHTLGNVAIVPLASTLANDQVRRALDAVRHWVFERALSLKPDMKSSTNFLDSLIDMLNLSFWLNKPWTSDMIRRAPSLSHAKYMTTPGLSEDAFYAPRHLVRAMEMSQPQSIDHGLAFLRFMLAPVHRFSINILHLSELIELLCGSSAMLSRFRRSSLHGLMLPKSWILSLLGRVDFSVPYMLNNELDILSVCDRWISVLSKSDFVKDYTHLGMPSRSVRAICISRICRAVSLLGYNIPSEIFRHYAVRMFRRLNSEQNYVHHLHKPYFYAKDWRQICNGVRKSISGTYMDEMVELMKLGERRFMQFAGVRQVTFRIINDIYSNLIEEPRSKLSATAAPFIPKFDEAMGPDDSEIQTADTSLLDSQLGDGDSLGDDDVGDVPSQGEADSLDPQQQSEDRVQTDSQAISKISLEDMAPVITQESTPQELAIVNLIKRRYKLRKQRRQAMNEESIQSKRVRQHFADCVQVTKETEWTARHRRVIFLGVVPYILACLDHFSKHATAVKRKTQKQLHGDHARAVNYEAIHERLEKIIKIQRSSLNLGKQLDPKTLSVTLRNEQPLDFKEVLEELQIIANGLGGAGLAEEELSFVVEVLSRKPRTAPTAPKPDLNVEDILEF